MARRSWSTSASPSTWSGPNHNAGQVHFLTPAYPHPEEVRGESLGVPPMYFRSDDPWGAPAIQSPDRIGRRDAPTSSQLPARPRFPTRVTLRDGRAIDHDLGAFLTGFPWRPGRSARCPGAIVHRPASPPRHRPRAGRGQPDRRHVVLRRPSSRPCRDARRGRSIRSAPEVRAEPLRRRHGGGRSAADLALSRCSSAVSANGGASRPIPPARAELVEPWDRFTWNSATWIAPTGCCRSVTIRARFRSRPDVIDSSSLSPTFGSPRHVSTTPTSYCARPARWATGCCHRPPRSAKELHDPGPVRRDRGVTRRRPRLEAAASDTRRRRRWPPNTPRRWLRSPSRSLLRRADTMPSAPTARHSP